MSCVVRRYEPVEMREEDGFAAEREHVVRSKSGDRSRTTSLLAGGGPHPFPRRRMKDEEKRILRAVWHTHAFSAPQNAGVKWTKTNLQPSILSPRCIVNTSQTL